MSQDKAAILEAVSAAEVWERCGREVSEKNSSAEYVKGRCIFHDGDNDASLTMYRGRGEGKEGTGFHCFGCQRSGDAITLWCELTGDSFREALGNLGGGSSIAPTRAVKKQIKLNPIPWADEAEYHNLMNHWPFNVKAPDGRPARWYFYPVLDKRGKISDGRIIEVKYWNKHKKAGGKSKGGWDRLLARLTTRGMVRGIKSGEYRWNRNAWTLRNKGEAKTWALEESKPGLYAPEVWSKAGDDWILNPEGPSDSKAAIDLGLFATTSPGGHSSLKAPQAALLEGHKIAVFQDFDDVGGKGAISRAEMWSRNGAAEVRIVPPFIPTEGEKVKGYDLRAWREANRGTEIGTLRGEILRMIESAPIFVPEKKEGEKYTWSFAPMTDTANAERFQCLHGESVKWATWGVNLVWNGKVFEPDVKSQAEYMTRDIFFQIKNEAREHEKIDSSKEGRKHTESLKRHAENILNDGPIIKCLKRCRSLPGFSVTENEMDANPYWLNTPDGIYDIKLSGSPVPTLMPHPEKPYKSLPLVSKITNISPDFEAEHPIFTQFLESSLVDENGDPDSKLIGYVFRVLGYMLVGDIREHTWFYLAGRGRNGKSLLMNLVSYILGSYVHVLQVETLLEKRGGISTITDDIPKLRGVRLAIASEPSGGLRLDDGRIKAWTGGELISGRAAYEKQVTIALQCTLVLMANSDPAVTDTSDGYWDRCVKMPWRRRFLHPTNPHYDPENPLHGLRDDELGEKLKAEAPAILASMMRNAMLWQMGGLGTCEAVETSTEEYRQSEMPLQEFIDACCTMDGEVTLSRMHEVYAEWMGRHGGKAWSSRALGRHLVETYPGISKRKTMAGQCLLGVSVKPEEPTGWEV